MAAGSKDRLGELLVRENLISASQLMKAQEASRKEGGRLSTNLTKLGFIKENELTQFLSKQYGVPSVDLSSFQIDPEIIRLIPEDVAEKHCVIAVNKVGSNLIVAMSDPSNIFAVDDLKFLTGYNIEVVVSSEASIREGIATYYQDESLKFNEVLADFEDEEVEIIASEEEINAAQLERASEDAPVVKLVNLILLEAIKKGASDIHIEPYEKNLRVRYRIDGVLHEQMKPPIKLRNSIVSRVKIMSSLDIAERRLPQDGRIKLKYGKGQDMEYRVSVLPTLFGEKVVMRLLDKSNLQLDMTKLGFEEKQLKDFQHAIHQPYGMVLVTGPTGSGKTTTLYSGLAELNKTSENLSTAEDPVEFSIGGINQVQMHEDIGLNFAAALRSFLRQDPDIIMVGEIRDFETAEIAIKAALTGHLVLSTLHTNDAPSTISRLLNMGIEPFLVASAVNAIVAQRLGRKICQECKVEDKVSVQNLLDIGVNADMASGMKAFVGKGCKACGETGYKGRIALYEVMVMKDELKDFVLNGASTSELKREAIRLGMQTLRMSAIKKISEGVTTIEEALRVTASDTN
ncbi:MAG: type IV-A pilus assembly ATPase PilB [Bradymonadales bacterium]|nr:MAG: type IV-A pilus assembly ATPase PilB [Bradymonadales bacterium]